MGSTPTFGTSRMAASDLGAWLSLVERSVRVAEVGGSNPLAPTTWHETAGRDRDRRFHVSFSLTGDCMNARIASFQLDTIS